MIYKTNRISIDMLTRTTMFDDEDDYTLQQIRKQIVEDFAVFPVPKGRVTTERYGPGAYYQTSSTRKPTRMEALERLPSVPKPVRRLSRRLPPNPLLIPFYALDLAELLIYVDPLDRIEG